MWFAFNFPTPYFLIYKMPFKNLSDDCFSFTVRFSSRHSSVWTIRTLFCINFLKCEPLHDHHTKTCKEPRAQNKYRCSHCVYFNIAVCLYTTRTYRGWSEKEQQVTGQRYLAVRWEYPDFLAVIGEQQLLESPLWSRWATAAEDCTRCHSA